MAIPIGHGLVMMQPKLEGWALQAPQIDTTDSALKTGSGCFAA